MSLEYEFDYVDEELMLYRVGHVGQMSKRLEVRQKCSDMIIRKFLQNNPSLLPPRTVQKAWAYTYLNRGRYFRHVDPVKSMNSFRLALKHNPWELGGYRGVLVNAFSQLKSHLNQFKLINLNFQRLKKE
jgi:hypothetical protein